MDFHMRLIDKSSIMHPMIEFWNAQISTQTLSFQFCVNSFEFVHFEITFVTCCVELADFCPSRDCCCIWLLVADDDIVSHVSDVLAADALAVFDDVSHLSGAFNWPCSVEATFDRLTDDIENVQHKWQCCWKLCENPHAPKFRALSDYCFISFFSLAFRFQWA